MRELSMHILDLAQNSIAAGAKNLEIEVAADARKDTLTIAIRDDGRGMSAEFVAKVEDPFTTTRTTRRVGLGIPMFAEAARACDGRLAIQSAPGRGTELVATFRLSHIDRAPLGDMASTLVTIVAVNPDLRVRYVHRVDDAKFVLDTNEIREQLDGVPLSEAPVLRWIAEYVRENIGGEMEIG